MTPDLQAALTRLQEQLQPLRGHKVALAFSAGSDSTLLLTQLAALYGTAAAGNDHVAGNDHAHTEGGVYAFLVSSQLHPHADVAEAQALCQQFKVPLEVLTLNELPAIANNPPERCYLCKKELMSLLWRQAKEKQCTHLIDGTNASDLLVYRPGLRAIKELQVFSPLAEANITKAQVRGLLEELKLAAAQKPSAPCLATRFAYNSTLNVETMRQIEEVETKLHAQGLYNVRVRVYPQEHIVRLEVDPEAIAQVVAQREEIVALLRSITGYLYFCLDLEGFTSGSMDKALKLEELEFKCP